MNDSILLRLHSLYNQFQNNDFYRERLLQLKIAPIFKDIIRETLQNSTLSNEHLTGFIQMFKAGTSDNTFDKYLLKNVTNDEMREKLQIKMHELNKTGITGAGLNSITLLSQNQLDVIKRFMEDAFEISNISEAVQLCHDYDAKNIPFVKKGIYSPWLYYIQPQLFPIINNSHRQFIKWLSIENNYPSCITAFNEIKDQLNIPDLALLDAFAHKFIGDIFEKPTINQLNLNGNRLFKMTHGILVKAPVFYNTGIINVLEENNWIALNKYTGKKQGINFQKKAKVGDIVYLCYGGDTVYCIAKITSDAKNLDTATASLINDNDGEWIYREIEILYNPIDSNIRDLKGYRTFDMPSGNSTFWEINDTSISSLNDKLFIPKFGVQIITEKITNPAIENMENTIASNKQLFRNSILYGPPGTGKTYNCIFHALSILDNKDVVDIQKEPFESVKDKFDNYVKAGRIVFTTFHQSMGYEDFIEGIKPMAPKNEGDNIQYRIEDGVFKTLCTEAAFSIANSQHTTAKENLMLFENAYDQFFNEIEEKLLAGGEVKLPTKNNGHIIIENVTDQGNISIKHPNGERNYTVSKKRLSKLDLAFDDLDEVTNINDAFRAEIGGHNSSAYWAVLNAIKQAKSSSVNIVGDNYDYDAKKELVQLMDTRTFSQGEQLPYVVIIDEINRGNIAQIFGELITLLEDDKRLGQHTALTVTLPYSKENFGVPPNLFVIGTMNTADRSVEALDTALRRRFSFISHMPKEDVLKVTNDGIDLKAMLISINKRLRILKDNDHTIGHAWLMNIDNIENLKIVYSNKILPLLQEYFYNDYEKLGLVLGDPFFEKQEQISSDIFARFSSSTDLAEQYEGTLEYLLKPIELLTVKDFQSLYI